MAPSALTCTQQRWAPVRLAGWEHKLSQQFLPLFVTKTTTENIYTEVRNLGEKKEGVCENVDC